jgi:hypothetical protein
MYLMEVRTGISWFQSADDMQIKQGDVAHARQDIEKWMQSNILLYYAYLD